MSDFQQLALAPALLDRLTAAQFSVPTPVQAATIPPALEGRDVLATAQTGTGKTLAFLIPALERMLKSPAREPRVLVLTPTRELAMQIARQYDQIRPRGLKPAALLVGGLSERPQRESLRQGATLVVATPGRLEDFIERRLIRLDGVQLLVLDEADRMLDIGFLPAIRRIVKALPVARQTLCYSATMAPEVAQLARESMRDPVRLALGSTSKPVDSVKLQAYEVPEGGKLELLQKLLVLVPGRSLIFARTKRGTDRLAKSLIDNGYTATVIHGNRSQAQRSKALEGFQQGHFQVLVATDVAARGIHVEDVAHVINYDFPEAPDDFVHRVGRTGRAGESGLASTFVCRGEMGDLQRLEKLLGIRLERGVGYSHGPDHGNGLRAGQSSGHRSSFAPVRSAAPRSERRPGPGPRHNSNHGTGRGPSHGPSHGPGRSTGQHAGSSQGQSKMGHGDFRPAHPGTRNRGPENPRHAAARAGR